MTNTQELQQGAEFDAALAGPRARAEYVLSDEGQAAADASIAQHGNAARGLAKDADGLASIVQQARKLGLNDDEMQALMSSSLDSPKAQAALDAAVELVVGAASRRTMGLQSLFDQRLARIQSGKGDAAEFEGELAGPVAGEVAADPSDEIDETYDFDPSSYDEAPEAVELLTRLSQAENADEQVALLQAALAAGAEGDPETEQLRLDNELLRMASRFPRAATMMEQLSKAESLEAQLAILEQIASSSGWQPASVDPNNPPRPLRAGLASTLAGGGEMNDEFADAIISAFDR